MSNDAGSVRQLIAAASTCQHQSISRFAPAAHVLVVVAFAAPEYASWERSCPTPQNKACNRNHAYLTC
jgi:hypothetical protein